MYQSSGSKAFASGNRQDSYSFSAVEQSAVTSPRKFRCIRSTGRKRIASSRSTFGFRAFRISM